MDAPTGHKISSELLSRSDPGRGAKHRPAAIIENDLSETPSAARFNRESQIVCVSNQVTESHKDCMHDTNMGVFDLLHV